MFAVQLAKQGPFYILVRMYLNVHHGVVLHS